jgi:hypothetical protein
VKKIREIKSKKGELHFERYLIFKCRWFNIFLHKIYIEDGDEHMHDHPWNFTNIILKGGYEEEYIKFHRQEYIHGSKHGHRKNTAGKIRFNRATDVHKIKSLIAPTTTLCITSTRFREWGYYVPEGAWKKEKGFWFESSKYRELKNRGKK